MKNECSGTKEWSELNVNICNGCSHDCLYCYAKKMAYRYGRISEGNWNVEKIRKADCNKNYRKCNKPGRVMFPSSHDITPAILPECLTVLEKLLVAGNDLLIVSKPHLECIQEICAQFESYKDQILFRFTIGACDDRILSFWEPNAPPYAERKACLKHAFEAGYQTSVSAEPMLDSENMDGLIADLLPLVTDSIWIGKMNRIRHLVDITEKTVEGAVVLIERGQTDQKIKALYDRHKDNPKIKWKESIKMVVGLELAKVAGTDM